MVRGSVFLRVGLALVFGYFSFMQFMTPTPDVILGAWVHAAIAAVVSFCLLFNIVPRFIALIGAAYLLFTVFTADITESTIMRFGLAMGCLSLALIHEEHITGRQRAILTHLFRKD